MNTTLNTALKLIVVIVQEKSLGGSTLRDSIFIRFVSIVSTQYLRVPHSARSSCASRFIVLCLNHTLLPEKELKPKNHAGPNWYRLFIQWIGDE